MAHLRKRHLSAILSERLKFSPIVGVMGHRQTGKSTLVSAFSKDYLSLDRIAILEQARVRPETFISNRKSPFSIDECQLAPELFPELKEWVRLNKKPGQFILSGSVRFTSRKAIRESLTGRIINLELLPMTISELAEEPLPSSLIDFLKHDTPRALKLFEENHDPKKKKRLNQYLIHGGLPGISFTRKPEIQADQFSSHFETILERDLPLIYQTRLSRLQIYSITRWLSENQGRPLNLMDAKNSFRVSDLALKRIIEAFEALYLIRIVPLEGGTRHSVIFFEDQGLASYLFDHHSEEQNQVRALYANIREQFHYRPELKGLFFQYRKNSGAYLPLAFRCSLGTVGILPILDEKINRSAYLCAESFLTACKGSKVIIAHQGKGFEKISDQIIFMPWEAI